MNAFAQVAAHAQLATGSLNPACPVLTVAPQPFILIAANAPNKNHLRGIHDHHGSAHRGAGFSPGRQPATSGEPLSANTTSRSGTSRRGSLYGRHRSSGGPAG